MDCNSLTTIQFVIGVMCMMPCCWWRRTLHPGTGLNRQRGIQWVLSLSYVNSPLVLNFFTLVSLLHTRTMAPDGPTSETERRYHSTKENVTTSVRDGHKSSRKPHVREVLRLPEGCCDFFLHIFALHFASLRTYDVIYMSE